MSNPTGIAAFFGSMHPDAHPRAGNSGWLDPADYPFCGLLEQNYAVIREELERLLQLRVWTVMHEGESKPVVPHPTFVGEGEPSWRLFGLYLHARPIAQNCRLCPRTAAVLQQIPKLTKAGFASLDAGYVMKRHIGHDPHNYRAHLGLIIPEGDCGMEVSGEARRWTEGRVTLFDDNQMHQAWNRTARDRFVLIVDTANREPHCA
jgi:beta-hydroxylase